MNHAAMKEKVCALYDGELDPSACQEVEAHCGGCLECRAMHERWKRAAGVFFQEPPRLSSEFFVQRVMDRIELWERPLSVSRRTVSLRWLVPALGLAAALCVLLLWPVQARQPVSVEMLLLEGTPGPAAWVLSNKTPTADQILGFTLEG